VEIIIIFLAFFVRLLPRLIRPDKTESDTWYHLSSSVSIYKNAYSLPGANDGYLLKGRYDYPFFSHWIVAVLLRDKILRFERFIGPTVDTIYIIIGFIYFQHCLEFYNVEDADSKGMYFLLLLTFSITMLKVSTGPRVYSFTPRVFGEFFSFLFFMFLHLFSMNGNSVYLVGAVVSGGLALSTSKFAAQVLLFFSILLSVILTDFIPVTILLLSMVSAIVFSKGHYLRVAKQQLKHMYKYAIYGQYHHPALKTRNKFAQYVLFMKSIFRKDFLKAYSLFQNDLVFLNIIYKNLDVTFALIVICIFPIEQIYIKWILIMGFIMFILTAYKPLQFLGEPDRYLDYLVVFSVAILVWYLPVYIINIILVIEIILYMITLVLYLKSSNNYGKEFLLAMQYIKENVIDKEKYTIHGILGMYINYPLYVLTNVNALAIEANYVFELANDKKLMPIDTVYTNDFEYLYSKYGVNIIVANKRYLTQNMKYDFSHYKLFYENTEYIVYIRKQI